MSSANDIKTLLQRAKFIVESRIDILMKADRKVAHGCFHKLDDLNSHICGQISILDDQNIPTTKKSLMLSLCTPDIKEKLLQIGQCFKVSKFDTIAENQVAQIQRSELLDLIKQFIYKIDELFSQHHPCDAMQQWLVKARTELKKKCESDKTTMNQIKQLTINQT